jgi:hypothetical protein
VWAKPIKRNCGSVDFTAATALQGICSTLQLHALRPRRRDLRLAYAANSTLAKFR